MAEINGPLEGIEDPIAKFIEYSREVEQEISKGQNALARQIFVEKKQEALIRGREDFINGSSDSDDQFATSFAQFDETYNSCISDEEINRELEKFKGEKVKMSVHLFYFEKRGDLN